MFILTLNMPTLGATEFLESLYSLACNEYDLKRTSLSTDNISFGDAKGDEMFAIGLGTMMCELSFREYDETDFIKCLPYEMIKKINDACNGNIRYNLPYNNGYCKKIK